MSNPSLPAARIDFSSGVPRSLDYGDVYHSAVGAREQARHVFLTGNGLPQRWRGRRHFAILETGFGLGHNLLATWAAWGADPDRCETLHFVSLERHPPSREDLAKAHQTQRPLPEADTLPRPPSPLLSPPLSQALIEAWPPLLKGLHTLELQASGLAPVRLTLALGDARRLLPQLVGSFDAFFLDGFAPWANPELWDPWLLRALGRLAAPGATAATWSVARTVRDGLKSAGFEVERTPGFGTKREMSVARFAPRAPQRTPTGRPQGPWTGERHAVVIGAGLAGACAAQALARQGWQCTVLDTAHTPASGASGNPAGLFHGVVHRDDGVHARLHRHAALNAARHYAELIRRGVVPGRVDGLLAVRDAPKTRRQVGPGSALQFAPQIATQDLPDLPGYVHGLSRQEASEAAAAALGGPALHFLQGGWVDPGAVVRHALDTPGVRFQGGAQVGALERANERDACWKVLDTTGAELARAPLVVLAAGVGLPVLAQRGAAPITQLGPLEVTRGQITWFASRPALARPVSGHGYAVSLPDGRLLCGASLRPSDEHAGLAAEDQRWNLERLKWLTGLEPATGAPLGGRVSWRLQTPDRLPVIGPVPRVEAVPGSRRDQVRFIDRQAGFYVIGALGSRGLIWAPLAAHLLCAWVEATPAPVEAELLDALDPARWLVRQARRPRLDEE